MEGSLQLNRSGDSKLLDQDTAALRSVSIETEVIEMKLIIKSQFSQPGEGGGGGGGTKFFFTGMLHPGSTPLPCCTPRLTKRVFFYILRIKILHPFSI